MLTLSVGERLSSRMLISYVRGCLSVETLTLSFGKASLSRGGRAPAQKTLVEGFSTLAFVD